VDAHEGGHGGADVKCGTGAELAQGRFTFWREGAATDAASNASLGSSRMCIYFSNILLKIATKLPNPPSSGCLMFCAVAEGGSLEANRAGFRVAMQKPTEMR